MSLYRRFTFSLRRTSALSKAPTLPSTPIFHMQTLGGLRASLNVQVVMTTMSAALAATIRVKKLSHLCTEPQLKCVVIILGHFFFGGGVFRKGTFVPSLKQKLLIIHQFSFDVPFWKNKKPVISSCIRVGCKWWLGGYMMVTYLLLQFSVAIMKISHLVQIGFQVSNPGTVLKTWL